MSASDLATVVRELLSRPLEGSPIDSLDAWWLRHRAATDGVGSTLVRAALGGFVADRLGYAFASGYTSALAALAPEAMGGRRGALCATERGGAHPRAIETSLAETGDGSFVLRGEKRWSTLSTHADVLLVVASAGEEAGRKKLRVVRVARDAAGVELRPMPETPFAPEIPHAELSLKDVRVEAEDVLPGDGYERYVKPFRTIEDMHVFAALAGHTVGLARREGLDRNLAERAIALLATLSSLSNEPPLEPAAHVVLAGIVPIAGAIADALASALPEGDVRSRWERDRPLLSVAGTARQKRGETAWTALAGS